MERAAPLTDGSHRQRFEKVVDPGLVMTGATAVEKRERISPEDPGIGSDEHADALERTTEFVA